MGEKERGGGNEGLFPLVWLFLLGCNWAANFMQACTQLEMELALVGGERRILCPLLVFPRQSNNLRFC